MGLIKITVTHRGEYSKAKQWLNRLLKLDYMNILNKYGQKGVDLLAANTPKDTGNTAQSWYFEVTHNADQSSVIWNNSNVNKGVPIAIILQYGHGTGTGGWVEGRDYINPSLRPVFDQMAEELWKEVNSV